MAEPIEQMHKCIRETVRETLRSIEQLRPVLDLANVKQGQCSVVRERVAQTKGAGGNAIFGEADLAAIELYFGSEAIRIDSDGVGGFVVINGRHRLYEAQQAGIRSGPVSISHIARRQLAERAARL